MSVENETQTVLLATDQSQSILVQISPTDFRQMAYSPYGHRLAAQLAPTCLGFNGEYREQHTGWYILGNGYRAYNPVLRRFHSPDDSSPFDRGGLNAYAYCLGDPINYRDPTGHLGIFGLGASLLSRLATTRRGIDRNGRCQRGCRCRGDEQGQCCRYGTAGYQRCLRPGRGVPCMGWAPRQQPDGCKRENRFQRQVRLCSTIQTTVLWHAVAKTLS